MKPITNPPTGRIMNAPPYTANDLRRFLVSISPPISTASSVAISSSDGGKNTVAITSEKKPNSAKSYLVI